METGGTHRNELVLVADTSFEKTCFGGTSKPFETARINFQIKLRRIRGYDRLRRDMVSESSAKRDDPGTL